MNRRGRPPKPEGALTAAQHKAAQRERDRVALWVEGAPVDGLTNTALIEALPALLSGTAPALLAPVLIEIGRRGGLEVTVTGRPAATD